MQATIVLAPLLVIAVATTGQDVPVPNTTQLTHSDQIAVYATTVVGVIGAEEICPGYQRNAAAITALRARMQIRDDDESELSR